MTRTANPLLFWFPAIMLSLLAHAAFVMMIHRGTQPDPVEMVAEIRTRIDVSSLDVPSQRAEAGEAESEVAEASEASGERLGVQAVPTSQARPVAAPGQQVAALAPDTPASRPVEATGDTVAAAAAPIAQLAAASVTSPSLTSAAAPTTTVAAAAMPEAVAATALPESTAAAAAIPQGTALATVQPVGAALTATAPDTSAVAAATADTATLAAASPASQTVAASAGPTLLAPAVAPPSLTMAAASAPAQALAGSRPEGAQLAPVAAGAARITTLAAAGPRVVPAAPSATLAVARPADATLVLASTSSGPAVSAQQPQAVRMGAVAAPAQAVATGRAQGVQVASLQAAPDPVATLDTASPGVSSAAAIAAPQGTEVAPAATGDIAGSVARTEASDIAVAATASLAWTGDAASILDEQSLAAIQSFMGTGDIAGSAAFAGSVRDGIGSALAQFPCSRLQAAFQPESGGLEIRGHIPSEDFRPAVVSMLQNTVGDSIPVGDSVLVLPSPQCGVLDAIEGLGVPQSRDQIDDPLVIGEEAQARIVQYEDGQLMTLTLTGADYDAYIYLDYYDGDGNVYHLLPSQFREENFFRTDEPFVIGDRASGMNLRAAAPFGQDIAVLLAATSPLYEGVRPLVERADDYLPWLHARVDAFRESDPGFRGEWAYLFVMTGPVGAFAGR